MAVVTVLVRCSAMEVRVEALRLAREHVKKEIRRKGFSLYEVSAKEITKSAEALLAARPQVMIEQATHRFPMPRRCLDWHFPSCEQVPASTPTQYRLGIDSPTAGVRLDNPGRCRDAASR